MKMKIKLCGLSRPQDIEAANTLMPDYVGFVFARKSRRYISPETAHRYGHPTKFLITPMASSIV